MSRLDGWNSQIQSRKISAQEQSPREIAPSRQLTERVPWRHNAPSRQLTERVPRHHQSRILRVQSGIGSPAKRTRIKASSASTRLGFRIPWKVKKNEVQAMCFFTSVLCSDSPVLLVNSSLMIAYSLFRSCCSCNFLSPPKHRQCPRPILQNRLSALGAQHRANSLRVALTKIVASASYVAGLPCTLGHTSQNLGFLPSKLWSSAFIFSYQSQQHVPWLPTAMIFPEAPPTPQRPLLVSAG